MSPIADAFFFGRVIDHIIPFRLHLYICLRKDTKLDDNARFGSCNAKTRSKGSAQNSLRLGKQESITVKKKTPPKNKYDLHQAVRPQSTLGPVSIIEKMTGYPEAVSTHQHARRVTDFDMCHILARQVTGVLMPS